MYNVYCMHIKFYVNFNNFLHLLTFIVKFALFIYPNFSARESNFHKYLENSPY